MENVVLLGPWNAGIPWLSPGLYPEMFRGPYGVWDHTWIGWMLDVHPNCCIISWLPFFGGFSSSTQKSWMEFRTGWFNLGVWRCGAGFSYPTWCYSRVMRTIVDLFGNRHTVLGIIWVLRCRACAPHSIQCPGTSYFLFYLPWVSILTKGPLSLQHCQFQVYHFSPQQLCLVFLRIWKLHFHLAFYWFYF